MVDKGSLLNDEWVTQNIYTKKLVDKGSLLNDEWVTQNGWVTHHYFYKSKTW